MRKPFRLNSLLSVAVAMASFGCQPSGQMESEQPAAEESMQVSPGESAQSIADDFAGAWNSGDAAGVAALFTEDGAASGPDGELYTSREQILAHYTEMLEGPDAGTMLSVNITSTRELQPGVLLANGGFEVSGMKTAEGEEMPSVKGLSTVVLVEDGGTWRIASLRSWVPLKAPGTT
jgi:uncharacterized protein (TIGR02246 family)